MKTLIMRTVPKNIIGPSLKKRSCLPNSPAHNHKIYLSLSTSNKTPLRLTGDKLRKQNMKERTIKFNKSRLKTRSSNLK